MLISRKGLVISLALIVILTLSFVNIAFAGDIVLNDLKSSPVNLSTQTGKPTILFFWTTWCPYCRIELKQLNQMSSQMEREGLVVFAVNIGEPEYRVKRFFKSYALNVSVLLDEDGLAADSYEIQGVPTYIFINKSGQIVSLKHTLPADYMNLLLK